MTDKNLEFWEHALRWNRPLPVKAVLKDYRDAVDGYELQIVLLKNRLEFAQKLLQEQK